MGNKARNAGTKKSKTCDKLANAKSLRFNGKGMKLSCATYSEYIDNPNILNERLNKQVRGVSHRYKQSFIIENTEYNNSFDTN